jgi:hypothetical protein
MGAISTLATGWANVPEYANMDTNRPLLHSEALQEHPTGLRQAAVMLSAVNGLRRRTMTRFPPENAESE